MEQLKSISQCELMIRNGSSTFYQAFRELDSPRREAVYVVYAFCRMIDDSVDEPDTSFYTLVELREGLERLETTEGHFIWPSLRWLFANFPVEREPFFKQMEGQSLDLKTTDYQTFEQLEQYCYLVAGTVGEMLLPILHDKPDSRVRESGIYLGKAMQIVNILRDVGEDQGRGRRYLPLELMLSCGYTEAEFQLGIVNGAFRDVVEQLARLADHWFQLGMRGLETYPTDSAFCIELAARMYHAIIDQVRSNKYNVYRKRAVVSSVAKVALYVELRQRYKFVEHAERKEA